MRPLLQLAVEVRGHRSGQLRRLNHPASHINRIQVENTQDHAKKSREEGGEVSEIFLGGGHIFA